MILNHNNKINVTFCGMMGSGKTAVGRKLANEIGFNFIDTDKIIEEKSGKSIGTIFEEKGEKYFRDLERDIICKILKKEKHVISLGGGSIIDNTIRKIIKKNSFNIYLNVKIDILCKRLSKSKNRPLILNTEIDKKLSKLLKEREKFYKQADLIISNETNLREIIIELKKIIKYEKNN